LTPGKFSLEAVHSKARMLLAMCLLVGQPDAVKSTKLLILWRARQNKTANTYVIEIPL
jgi:hypothetical protein